MSEISSPNSNYTISPVFEAPKPLINYKDSDDTYSNDSLNSEEEDSNIFYKLTPAIDNPFLNFKEQDSSIFFENIQKENNPILKSRIEDTHEFSVNTPIPGNPFTPQIVITHASSPEEGSSLDLDTETKLDNQTINIQQSENNLPVNSVAQKLKLNLTKTWEPEIIYSEFSNRQIKEKRASIDSYPRTQTGINDNLEYNAQQDAKSIANNKKTKLRQEKTMSQNRSFQFPAPCRFDEKTSSVNHFLASFDNYSDFNKISIEEKPTLLMSYLNPKSFNWVNNLPADTKTNYILLREAFAKKYKTDDSNLLANYAKESNLESYIDNFEKLQNLEGMNNEVLKKFFIANLSPHIKRVFSRGVPSSLEECIEIARRENNFQLEGGSENKSENKSLKNVFNMIAESNVNKIAALEQKIRNMTEPDKGAYSKFDEQENMRRPDSRDNNTLKSTNPFSNEQMSNRDSINRYNRQNSNPFRNNSEALFKSGWGENKILDRQNQFNTQNNNTFQRNNFGRKPQSKNIFCYICGERNSHLSNQCNNRANMYCPPCNQNTHCFLNCPARDICSICSRIGHSKEECRNTNTYNIEHNRNLPDNFNKRKVSFMMLKTQRNFSEQYQNFHDSESSSESSEHSSEDCKNDKNKILKKRKQTHTKFVQTTLSRPQNIVRSTTVLQTDNDNMLTVKCMIKQKEYDLLLDTGSDVSILSLETLTKINKGSKNITIHEPDLTCRAAAGQEMEVLGKIFLNIYINGKKYPHHFYILESLLSPGIIGLDFLCYINVA